LESLENLKKRCSDLDAVPLAARTPLWGILCAVKDNVDVAGMPTTAGCPKFQYHPDKSAPAMHALFEAGDITCRYSVPTIHVINIVLHPAILATGIELITSLFSTPTIVKPCVFNRWIIIS
jgi:hypothetical protein